MAHSGAPAPPFAATFVFEVDGVEIGSFQEVTGLSVQLAVEEFVEGGNNESPIRLPGALKWSNLVLKRGVTDSNSLFDWMKSCSGEAFDGSGNKVERMSGSVTLSDSMGGQVRQWTFEDAMPVRWNGPQFAAGANALAQEELEVSHSGITAG